MRRAVAITVAITVATLATGVMGSASVAGVVPSITEFKKRISPDPRAITAGPDGRLWFTENDGATTQIGRITTDGVVRQFPVAAPASPEGIALGPDHRLWVTQHANSDLLRVTAAGVITHVPLGNCCTEGITAGPDGRMWFDHNPDGPGLLGRVTTGGKSKEFFVLQNAHSAYSITAGPDGNLWVADPTASRIVRVTTAGTVTGTFATTAPPFGITVGPDNNLWFTEYAANQIGRMTTSGVVVEFPIPTAHSGPVAITAGPDGALWFTENGADQIGRVTTVGTVSEIPVPTANSGPSGITAGPDGNIWFTESTGNKIGRVNLL
jgi:streptogramin lyase